MKIVISIFLFFIVISCALKPFPSEKKYVNEITNEYFESTLGNGRVLFYNYDYYCPTMTCGKTTKVNIIANNVSFGQLNYGEFFVVDLEYGDYVFETLRKDVFNFKSKYNIKIDSTTKAIKICANTLQKSLKVTNQLPVGFGFLTQKKN